MCDLRLLVENNLFAKIETILFHNIAQRVSKILNNTMEGYFRLSSKWHLCNERTTPPLKAKLFNLRKCGKFETFVIFVP